MACLSKQLLLKFACIVIACLVTFAGIMMSVDLLQHMLDKADTNLTMFWSGTKPHFNYRMEQYEACIACTSYHHSVPNGVICCRKGLNRKWGALPPHASRSRLLLNSFGESKLRMTPQAQRWHPFLRRTKGFLINYTKQSNSSQYTYLFPDPVPDPNTPPATPIALAPLFGVDYGLDGIVNSWTDPNYFTNPPITGWVEPPIA